MAGSMGLVPGSGSEKPSTEKGEAVLSSESEDFSRMPRALVGLKAPAAAARPAATSADGIDDLLHRAPQGFDLADGFLGVGLDHGNLLHFQGSSRNGLGTSQPYFPPTAQGGNNPLGLRGVRCCLGLHRIDVGFRAKADNYFERSKVAAAYRRS
jgi:hypothetical protein